MFLRFAPAFLRSWKMPHSVLLRRIGGAAFVAAWLAGTLAAGLALAQSAGGAAPAQPTVAELILDLDADAFELRDRARDRLSALARQADERLRLEQALAQRLQSADLSLETRASLTALALEAGLGTPPADPGVCSTDEADRLVQGLSGERFEQRVQAQTRMLALLTRADNVRPVFAALHRRMVDPALSAAQLSVLGPAWQRVRAAWLAADADTRRLPEASDDQIEAWIERLRQPLTEVRSRTRQIAGVELELRLADDAQAAKVAQHLAAAVEGNSQNLPALNDLFDLTQPTVAAEIWRQGSNVTIQYLVVGRPQWPQMSGPVVPRTYTLFDRADEHSAHLVNGNTLTPGDYPVGQIFPFQASQFIVIFRLAYLPTPRERMLHEASVREPDAIRWARHCRSTLDRYLAENHELTDLELQALEEFDAQEMSRFAGHYLEKAPDRALGADGGIAAGIVGSRHAVLCVLLAQRGTPGALPGLVKATSEGRILPANAQTPYSMPWIAAMAIAGRSPEAAESQAAWAQLLGVREPLEAGLPERGEVDATAAAWLLRQAGEEPASFRLTPIENRQALAFGCPPAYRFASDEGRDAVRRWYAARHPAAADAP